ncbi:hypothetical protein EZJ43_05790 [Pedobacter changchengzhani]|uniref:Uncharacterized protein n=1 Tax=Pedobacter changchengzhani TaxID=2529274 RepID=A0A4V3A0A9_9SPHI|nr:hypothetical protein [Pedobacter changchengzhani]TDG36793.1 hypothetical protein EZJ43_05790 [Pedobacter changchengzhani]
MRQIGVFNADITLSLDYFSGSSKESVIANLIHEVLHSYLAYTGDNTLNSFQHKIISEKYVNPMAIYLKTYFSMDIKDAYALAWSGLSDSNAYNNNTPNDTEYLMSNGEHITAGEIATIAGLYNLSTNDPQNNGYTKGTKICN